MTENSLKITIPYKDYRVSILQCTCNGNSFLHIPIKQYFIILSTVMRNAVIYVYTLTQRTLRIL